MKDLQIPLATLPRRCAIAVSGGLDSVSLLHAMVSSGLKPEVWHFNHRWRTTSTQEACFVGKLASGYGLVCRLGQAPLRSPKTETKARELRSAFFQESSQISHLHHLVLAHQADDQVETFLWQLLRGTGSQGAGMAPRTRREILTLHRPWLSIWRSQIETYARQQRLIWHQDATNSDVKYTRNRLRHNVLPYLRQEISPQVDKALWRAAEILRGEQEWLERLVGPLARLDRLPVAKLRIQPLAKVRRILKQWLQHQGIRDVGFDEVEKVRSLLHQDKPAKVNLPGQRHARRRSGWLFLE